MNSGTRCSLIVGTRSPPVEAQWGHAGRVAVGNALQHRCRRNSHACRNLRRDDLEPNIDRLLELRKQYAVSSEASFSEFCGLLTGSASVFSHGENLTLQMAGTQSTMPSASRHWNAPIESGFMVSSNSVISQCTAIGYRAKASEKWVKEGPAWRVESLGIPPYPGRSYPRVLGIVWPADKDGVPGTGNYLSQGRCDGAPG